MVDSDYTSKMRKVADDIIGMRNQSGNTALTVVFGTLALLKSKNKITEKDLEIIFSVEKSGIENTLDDYFQKNYGESDFEMQSEQDLEVVKKYCSDYVDSMQNYVKEAADELGPTKKKKSTQKQENNNGEQ